MLIPVVAFVLAAGILRRAGETEVVDQEVLWALAALGSAVAIFAAVFIVNLAYAPVALHQRQAIRIAELEPRRTLDFEARVQGGCVYIAVTNNGEPDNFIAQVTEATSDDEMVVPWSMRWRQWGESESRPILKNDTRLIDVGCVASRDGRDDEDRYGQWCYYRYVSTTAQFDSPMWLAHYWERLENGEDKVVDIVPEAENLVLTGLYVEIRGEKHNAIGGGWICLGVHQDGTPHATLERTRTQSDSGREESEDPSGS